MKENNTFEKEYFINKSTEKEKKCKDKIEIIFDGEKCDFRINIFQKIYVEDQDWCAESSTSYSFSIKIRKPLNYQGRKQDKKIL